MTTPDAPAPQPPASAPQPYHSAPQPPWPPQYTPGPPPRRRTGLWVALGVALVLALVGGATALGLASRDDAKPTAAVASTLPPSSPSLSPAVTLSPSAPPSYSMLDACRRTVSLLSDAADLVDRITKVPDGSTVSVYAVQDAISGFREVQPFLPPNLRSLVDDVVTPLDAIWRALTTRQAGPAVKFDRYQSAGVRLVAGCGPYASASR